MSYYIGNYTTVHSYHEGKKGYVNKFEKSLTLPFLNALQHHMPSIQQDIDEDVKLDVSDIVISENAELSSAVVSATGAGDSDPGIT